MKTIIIAVLKLAASALWVCGFVTIAKDVNAQVVSGGSGGPSSMWDVFMQLGLFGIFQSIGALRGAYACWFGTMETELCTRHFNIWKNSSGNVVAAEEDHSAPVIGCLVTLIVGGFIVIACSALISPILFMINVSTAILLFAGGINLKEPLVKVLMVVLCVGCISGTIYGWNYISKRMDVLQERRKVEKAERQKQLEAQRAERERIAAEQRAEQERIAAEKRAEEERLRAERRAEKERQRAQRQAELNEGSRRGRRGSYDSGNDLPQTEQVRGATSVDPSQRARRCRKCGGSGKETVYVTCPTCEGRHTIPNPNAALGGLTSALPKGRRNRRGPAHSMEIPCPAKCSRTGKISQQVPCRACGGMGMVQ